MAKSKSTLFFCQVCGYESVKWMGQCPGCKEWNTFVEEPVIKTNHGKTKALSNNEPSILEDIEINHTYKCLSGIEEFDRVMGEGVVPGSLVLIGGDPGIGKSTLLLQVCRKFSGHNDKVLYISGEESLQQIKMRADRLGEFSDTFFLMCETNLTVIEETIRKYKPKFVVIDSIQTMYHESVNSSPGSVSQVRETTGILMQIAKGLQISVFIVGHVTKEGVVAGPRVLEHMVDTVLYFEGERHASYRILRSVKNRFGSTHEIGVFQMEENGLTEVKNPSAYMLKGKPKDAAGSIVVCSMEGTRPILIEIQALVCRSFFQIPRRQATGTDYNRVNLLMAVLEKRVGIHLSDCDAYVNIVGGLKVNEPAIDLGITMAVVSSYKNRSMEDTLIVFGEIGLSGEIRPVNMAKQRVLEAKKLGFKTCVVPDACMEGLTDMKGMKIIGVKTVAEAIAII